MPGDSVVSFSRSFRILLIRRDRDLERDQPHPDSHMIKSRVPNPGACGWFELRFELKILAVEEARPDWLASCDSLR